MIGILGLQNNKRELASAALSGNVDGSLTKLTLNDIMSESTVTSRLVGLTYRLVSP